MDLKVPEVPLVRIPHKDCRTGYEVLNGVSRPEVLGRGNRAETCTWIGVMACLSEPWDYHVRHGTERVTVSVRDAEREGFRGHRGENRVEEL